MLVPILLNTSTPDHQASFFYNNQRTGITLILHEGPHAVSAIGTVYIGYYVLYSTLYVLR